MKIEQINLENEYLWDDYVKKHENSMIYYTLKFRDLIAKITDAVPLYFMAMKEFEVVGVLPLMQKEGRLGKVINTLPFYGSHGGVLADNKDAKTFLIKFYKEIIGEDSVVSSTLIENIFSQDNALYASLEANVKDYRIGQLTNISGDYRDLEDLLVCFHSKTRNTIRKAVKSEVVVSVENNMFEFLERTHIENMSSIGGLAKSHIFFDQIRALLQSNSDYKIYVARHMGRPIAALLNLYFGHTVEYFTPVIDKNYRHLQPLSLLVAQAMLDASKEGFKWWNWGGTWPSQEGVYKFKSRWGTQDIKYEYHICINNVNVYETTKQELLNDYAGFYVVPFDKLKK